MFDRFLKYTTLFLCITNSDFNMFLKQDTSSSKIFYLVLKTYGKLLNHLYYLINPVNVQFLLLQKNQIVKYDTKSILKTFKSFYSKLTGNLLTKLPKARNRYAIDFVSDYQKRRSLSKNSKLDSTAESYLFNLLKNVKVTKVSGRKILNRWSENFGKTYQ